MNYKRVIEDFNNGTIDPGKWQVIMDNDGGYWECIDYDVNEETRDKMCEEMSKKYGDPNGYRDIVDVLNGAGVNADWCQKVFNGKGYETQKVCVVASTFAGIKGGALASTLLAS